ncbi:thiol:disulfide interchange protein DsbD [Luteibacter sp. Sphag1AF]|uniref:protein-disulfide reductase DsbD family protein n=1 Tax=Luteibacter sp. Sphag1AF TaxID=2587031 RepID=UPI00185D3709|nr:protein-disulfide reductase DsbD [Luteibacter sp. Sphag1AF]MBB3226119.1 thiol:disulfide interchange protein DsbD [Luteibacter sp. Sphag1AF]
MTDALARLRAAALNHGVAMVLVSRFVRTLFVLVCLGFAFPALAQSDDDLLPVTDAFHLTPDASQPGVVKLHWAIAPDYYLYRGRIKIKAEDPAAVTLGEPSLPDGIRKHDEYLGDVEIYHGQIEATVPYTLADAASKTLKLSVQYQGCHEVDPKICYPPNTEHLNLTIGAPPAAGTPVTTEAQASTPSATGGAALLGAPAALPGTEAQALPADQAFRFETLVKGRDGLLLRWTMPRDYYLYRDKTVLTIKGAPGVTLGEPDWPSGVAHHDEHFGDTIVYFDQVELPVALNGADKARTLTLDVSYQGCLENGICYPVMTREVSLDLEAGTAHVSTPSSGPAVAAAPAAATEEVAPTPPPPGAGEASVGIAAALGLALLGGLILNLMPCVLPVLSLKAITVLESGESPAQARRHALYYTAGVLVSFAAVGLAVVGIRAAGHAANWGAQFQQPVLVAVLVYVMLAVGLSLSGVVNFGASLGNVGSGLASRSGRSGDFFTGVLAVVVASPCTAPFMGSAIAYAFAAPMAVALLIFLVLGLGLALPFLIIGFVPAVARLLPRPGRWMETLKQALAFPMYLTAVWLLWVLAKQRGADAVGLVLVGAVLLSMALWWFERSRGRSGWSRALVLLLGLGVASQLWYVYHLPAATPAAVAGDAVAYSPEKLAELRKSGTPVFVDMTADWCITCKANEKAVLDTDEFRDLLKRTGTVYMKGDWTDVNATIAAFLEQYHSVGVPLYVFYPKDGSDGRKLSTVLTYDKVQAALEGQTH